MEEGFLSLQKGAVVIEMNLSCRAENQEWRFTLKGESLSFSSLKLPETGPLENKNDVEGVVLEKIYLIEKIISIIDRLYQSFLKRRSSETWTQHIVPQIKQWIQS